MASKERHSTSESRAEHVVPSTQAENTASDNVHHRKEEISWKLLWYMIIIGLSLGLYGYDNSFASPLFQLPLFIFKYQGLGLTFTARNLNLLVPVPLVGAALGTFVASPALKRFGRKRTMICAYIFLCTPGSFLQLFAPNLAALIVGRFWNYIGISVLTTAAPLFISELVPPHFRGRAIGFCFAGVAAVGVLATTVVWGTQKITDRRQYMIPLAIQAACPAVLCLLTFFLPESPVWDLQHGRLDSAHRTLMSLRNNQVGVVDAELAMHRLFIDQNSNRIEGTVFWHILDRDNLKRTLTAGALISLSQVGGQILVGTYATVILVQSGVGNPFEITIIITCLQFLGIMIGPFLVDKVGRRPVALIGFTILFFLNMAAGGLGAAGLTTEPQRLALATVFILFGFFNATSFQALCFVLPTEISTPSLREPTVAWTVFWSYVTSVITTFAVPQIMNPDAANLGVKTAFIFAGCVLVTVIGSYFYLPETKDRSLAEINEMYRIGLPMWKWRGYKSEAATVAGSKMDLAEGA